MNTQNLETLQIHKLTQAQYDRELAAGRIDENALYLTPDDSLSANEVNLLVDHRMTAHIIDDAAHSDIRNSIPTKASDIGAWAESAPVSEDCNVDIQSATGTVFIKRYGTIDANRSTLNSPHSAGLTTYSQGVVITYAYSAAYGTQIAFAGPYMFTRNYVEGAISNWFIQYSDLNKPTASDIGAVPVTRKINNKSLSEDLSLTANDIGAFGLVGEIPKDADLDNYYTLGSYYCAGTNATTIANSPVTLAFNLYVLQAQDSRVIQLLTVTSTNDAQSTIYYRKRASAAWSTWKSFATTDYALPRDGSGAMTGSFKFNSASPLIHPQEDSSATYLRLFSGVGTSDAGYAGGAGIQLYNSAHATQSLRGRFRIHANDGTLESVLYGTPNGVLKWCNNDIYHIGNITAGRTDLTAGTSTLATGSIYDMYD